MILVDTSVWIDYFRERVPELAALLGQGLVVMHPFVVGELACGNLANRDETLSLLRQLQSSAVAEHEEVIGFIEGQQLFGRGIGYVDVHLLASAAIDGSKLWTRDRRLRLLAASLGLAARGGRAT